VVAKLAAFYTPRREAQPRNSLNLHRGIHGAIEEVRLVSRFLIFLSGLQVHRRLLESKAKRAHKSARADGLSSLPLV
jgi:hypothetical protein